MSFLDIAAVSYAYAGEASVVAAVDWRIPKGAFHCLVGRSGCGKTTLLKLAAGLLMPSAGQIRIDGARVVAPSQDVGFVFQAPTLLEWRPVLDNVLLPVSLKRAPSAEDRARAGELLALMGIGELAARYPLELSGGQQSRVAIARALIGAPKLLLMDEPFAALDAMTREELQADLLEIARARETTVLFVTHDIAEAVFLADLVAVMEAGRIQAVLKVALPRPRAAEIRHDSRFNAFCLEARQAMRAPLAA